MKAYHFFGANYIEKDGEVFYSILGHAWMKSILTIKEIKEHPMTVEIDLIIKGENYDPK